MPDETIQPRVEHLEEAQMFAERRLEQLLEQVATLERALAATERRLRTLEDRLGEIQRAGGNDPDA